MTDAWRLIIHAPIREKRDYRQVLVGFKNALCVRQIGKVTSYDLLPTFKPRKGQEHRLVVHLAEQLKQGWTLVIWDVDRLKLELGRIVSDGSINSAKLKSDVGEAWKVISNADDEQFIDLMVFEDMPNGQFVGMVACKENFDYDRVTPSFLRRARAHSTPSPPATEQYWAALRHFLLKKSDAERAASAYRSWVDNNRPNPPLEDKA